MRHVRPYGARGFGARPVDLEVAGVGSYGANPSTSMSTHPLAFGVGARAGVSALGVHDDTLIRREAMFVSSSRTSHDACEDRASRLQDLS